MSHLSRIEIEIQDLDALETAARQLGMKLVRGAQKFDAYQKGNSCEHKLTSGVPGHYEIGIVKNIRGKYQLAWDTFAGGGGLVKHIADKAGIAASRINAQNVVGTIKQHYGLAVAEKQARAKGYTCRRTKLPNGTIKLTASKA